MDGKALHLRVHAIGVSVLVGTIFLSISPGLAQDAEFIAITKSQHFEQFTPLLAGLKLPAFVDAEDAPFRFEAFAEAAGPGLMTAATVTLPGGLMYPLPMLDESEWATVEGFGIFGQMEAAYPPGTYQIQVDTAHDGSPIVDLDLPATGYPTLTTFLNFEAAQIIDATVPFTVTWDPIPGGTEDDVVSFEIDDVMGSPDIGEPGQLTGLDTEFTIPGGTLEPGREYSASLRVFRPVDSDNSYSGVFTVSALGKTVRMPLRTIGGADTENPLFLFSTPAPGTAGVDLNSIVTFWFNEAMDPAEDPGQAIDWSGVSDPSLFSYSWSRDRQRLFCNYGPGLPLSTTVQWTLNPPSASDSLRDMAGNPLPEGTSGHFITSDVSNLGEPDVRSLFLGKAKSFYQDGSAPEEIGLYSALLFAELNGIGTVSRVGLEIPGRGVAPNLSGWSFGFREIESDLEFAEASDLNRIFPSGDYTVILQTAHDGTKRVPLSIGADAYPNAPVVRDFASTQEIDSNRPFTLEWDAMTGGTSADFIELVIEGEFTSYYESPAPGELGALDGTATSITIPPGTLPPGRTLWAELGIAKVIDTESGAYPGVEVAAAFTSITYLQLRTSGPPFQPQLQIEHMGAQAKVTVTGEIGHQYELRASDNLQDWFAVAAGFLDSDRDGYKASFEFLDEIMGISQRFYQAVEMPFRN